MTTKTCSSCGAVKPVSEFHKFSRSRDGLQSRCKGCVSEYDAARHQRDRERRLEQIAAYRADNADRAKEYAKEYYQANKKDLARRHRKWEKDHPEKKREYWKKYYESNREAQNNKSRKYRARKRGAPTGTLPRNYYSLTKEYYGNECLVPGCHNSDVQIDHVVPLALGGVHGIENFQTLCRHHNSQKGARESTDYRNGDVFCLP